MGLTGQCPLAFPATQPGWGQESICHHYLVLRRAILDCDCVLYKTPEHVSAYGVNWSIVTTAVSRQSYKLELLPAI